MQIFGYYGTNIGLTAAKYDIELKVMHIQGKVNRAADLLLRWSNSHVNKIELQSIVNQSLYEILIPLITPW